MLVPAKSNRITNYDDGGQVPQLQQQSPLDVLGAPGAAGGGIAEIPQRNPLEIVWRRRWVVVAFVVAAVACGFVYVKKATPIYSSSSRLYVEQNGPAYLDLSGGGPSRQAGSYLYAQVEMIQSAPVIAKALESIHAERFKTFAGGANPVLVTKGGLSVDIGKKDELITVTFESPYPEEAAQVANAVVDSYLDSLGVNQTSSSEQVLQILQAEKKKRDAELEAAVKKMLDFRQQHDALALEYDKNNITLQKLSRLSDQLDQAQIDASSARAEAASVAQAIKDEKNLGHYLTTRQMVKGEIATSSTYDSELTELRKSVRQYEMDVGMLEKVSGSSHPLVVSRYAALEQLRSKMHDVEREYGRAFLSEANRVAEVAERKVADVQAMFDQTRKAASNVSSESLQYAMLETDMKRAEQRADQLETRIKDLSLQAEDKRIGQMKAKILDVARPADGPAKPKKAMILAGALALGLMLGCGSALAADWMDQRLRSVEEVRVTLGSAVLGVIPHMQSKRGLVSCGQAVALEPMSETAEAYRTIRTAVYFGTPDADAKRLVITSPAPGDGKSTLASNLAIAMAKAGQRVVLLDCDFRRPTQHKVFELQQPEVGLSSVVAGQATLEQATRHAAAVEGLDIVPCGPIPSNPAELLNSQAFADLLDQLAAEYDHVLIDAPPVLAVTDARIIAAIADQTILVLRAEKSTRNMSLAARDGILSVGGQLLGVVVNDVPKAKKRDGYYYSYGHYRYGYYGQGQIAPAANGGANGKSAALVSAPANGRNGHANGKGAASTHTSSAPLTDELGETGN